jgi:uncharacterized membrane protein YgaE (UPF0421/DUF939 family)
LSTEHLNRKVIPYKEVESESAVHDASTMASSPRPEVRVRERWIDRFVASDPGLGRLRFALQNTVTIAAILGAEWLFVHFSHALQIQTDGAHLAPAQAAQIAGSNRFLLIIAMVLGGLVGLFSSLGVLDPTPKGQLISVLLLPVPAAAAFTLGLALSGHRVIDLILLPVVLAAANYGRRFGARGFAVGLCVSVIFVIGVVSHSAVDIGQVAWPVAEIGVGVLAALLVRFGLFYPRPANALRRTQRAYRARASKVAATALALFDDPDYSERAARQLHHQLVGLNEAALMIDGQLGNPSALGEGTSGQLLHQRLFDTELALANTARFAQAMGRLKLSTDERREARRTLIGVVDGDPHATKIHAGELLDLLRSTRRLPADEDQPEVVILHRFATSVTAWADAIADPATLGESGTQDEGFQSEVGLGGGWLPAAAAVSAVASLESGDRRRDRTRLAPYTRSAIQMAVAVAAAVIFGDLLSGPRFFWAVITVFVIFTGTNNSSEQSIKAVFRASGTAIGFILGGLLAHVAGHDHPFWALAIILLTLFLSFYLNRINYAVSAVGITVVLALAFGQQGVFSNSLLLLRVEETAIGAGIGIVVASVIFPLSTGLVLRVALRRYYQAVGRLVEHATAKLVGDDHNETTLSADARALDAAYHAVLATAQPTGRNLFGGPTDKTALVLRIATAARNYSRNLVTDVEATGPLDNKAHPAIQRARETLHQSLNVVVGAISGSRDVTYTQSSALFDRAERDLEQTEASHDGQLPIRDVKLIDATMTEMAEFMGLAITDCDTVGAE